MFTMKDNKREKLTLKRMLTSNGFYTDEIRQRFLELVGGDTARKNAAVILSTNGNAGTAEGWDFTEKQERADVASARGFSCEGDKAHFFFARSRCTVWFLPSHLTLTPNASATKRSGA